MTAKEMFRKFAESEKDATVRVIGALPKEKLDYAPHPKSKTAKDIMNIILWEPGFMQAILEKGSISMEGDPHGMPPAVEDPAEAAEKFGAGYDKFLDYVASMPEENLGKEASIAGGGSSWTTTRGQMAMGFLGDMIHHRGQLSAYLRPMGGKVPSIYGPSGDSGPITM